MRIADSRRTCSTVPLMPFLRRHAPVLTAALIWLAVAQRGGPIRGLDRHRPAFGDALSAEQLETTIRHLWTFCQDSKWPRGDLNLPRAFYTEKALPENGGQFEAKIPLPLRQNSVHGRWSRGLGDLEAYDALEPKRFVSYNNAMSSGSSVVVATASVRFDPPNR